VDWHWQGEALNIGPVPGSQCTSQAVPAAAWGLSQTVPQIAEVTGVFIGQSAVAPIPPAKKGGPPVHAPLATPNAWVPCL
jgi:hypothetical protein